MIEGNEAEQSATVATPKSRKSSGRRRRKGCKQYFDEHYRNVRFWSRLEWISLFITLILAMYVGAGVASNVINLSVWDMTNRAAVASANPFQIHLMLGAQCLLSVAVIFSLLYLFMIRNTVGLILAITLLFLSALMFIAVASYLSSIMFSKEALLKEILDYTMDQISRIGYMFSFYDLQDKANCCGVRSYKDWAMMGQKIGLVKDSVPESCCKDELVGVNRSTCGEGVLSSLDTAKLRLNTEGCGSKVLARKYKRLFVRYIAEAGTVAAVIVVGILVTGTIGRIMWKMSHPKKPSDRPDPREQEDDIESEIIPGTPVKSYISSREGTFYPM